MRPPWDHSAHVAGELEALQTDVMRFIAILGLCLAAIFSLVNGAQEDADSGASSRDEAESSTASPESVELPRPAPFEERLEEPAPLSQTADAPVEPARLVPQPSATEPSDGAGAKGFTLEFQSGDVLERLLESGRTQLFAGAGGRFWVYRTGGGFQPAETPASYYRMQAETVPLRFRSLMPGAGPGKPQEWGVTLPESTLLEIQQLIKGRRGGSLLIDADAGVKLETGPPAAVLRQTGR